MRVVIRDINELNETSFYYKNKTPKFILTFIVFTLIIILTFIFYSLNISVTASPSIEGYIFANEDIILSNKVSAEVISCNIKDGMPIEKGMSVYSLSNKEFSISLENIRNEYLNKMKELNNNKKAKETLTNKFEENLNIDKIAILRKTEETISLLEKDINLIEGKLYEYNEITENLNPKSKVSGIVKMLVNIKKGDFLEPETKIAIIIPNENYSILKAKIPLQTKISSKIYNGQKTYCSVYTNNNQKINMIGTIDKIEHDTSSISLAEASILNYSFNTEILPSLLNNQNTKCTINLEIQGQTLLSYLISLIF